MSRTDIAMLLLGLFALALAAVIYQTKRYADYRRALTRGRRNLKPVRKPFWMN